MPVTAPSAPARIASASRRSAARAERLEAHLARPARSRRATPAPRCSASVRTGGFSSSTSHPAREGVQGDRRGGCAAACRSRRHRAARSRSIARWSVKSGTSCGTGAIGRRPAPDPRRRPSAARRSRAAARGAAGASGRARWPRSAPTRGGGHGAAPARVRPTPCLLERGEPVGDQLAQHVVRGELGREDRRAGRAAPSTTPAGAQRRRRMSVGQRVVERQRAAVVGGALREPHPGGDHERAPSAARRRPPAGRAIVCSTRCGSFCEPSIATCSVRWPIAGLANRSSTDVAVRDDRDARRRREAGRDVLGDAAGAATVAHAGHRQRLGDRLRARRARRGRPARSARR